MKSTRQETSSPSFEVLFGDLRSLVQGGRGTPSQWHELLALLEQFEEPRRTQAALPYASSLVSGWDDEVRRFAYRMPHGKLASASLTEPDFLAAPALFTLARHVSVDGPISALDEIARAPLSQLTHLRLANTKIVSGADVDAVLEFVARIPKLLSLELCDVGLGRRQLELLERLPHRDQLRVLKVREASLSAKHAEALVKIAFPSLTHFDMVGTPLVPKTVERLFHRIRFTQLTGLGLPNVTWSHSLVMFLRSKLDESPVRELDLTRSQLHSDNLDALLSGEHARELERLDLSGCGITDWDCTRISRNRKLANLEHLGGIHCSENHISVLGWQRLHRSHHLRDDLRERIKRAGSPGAV